MRIASGLSWTLLVVLFCSCLSQPASATGGWFVDVSQQADPKVADLSVAPKLADDAFVQLRFESEVRAILEDSKGNYWFGSWNEGVSQFDGKRLTYFTMEDGLSDNQIRTIHEDRNGLIWFEGGYGISRYDRQSVTPSTNRDYSSKDRWRVAPGDLWFKGDLQIGFTEREGSPGVYRYDGREITYLTFPLPEDRESDSYYSVTDIARGRDGRRWFATYGNVVGYDGKSFTIIDNKSLGLTEETGFLHVRCVFEDSKGRIWIGNNGIGVFLRDGDTTINFTQAKGVGRRDGRSGGNMDPQPGDAPDGAASLHRVFSIGEDRDGNIWFGTVEQGAWRYDGESLRRFAEEDGLATKGVMSIYTDSRGDLWLGGHGVYKFNGESFDRIH
jgi:ligand-binding sensor domain-containing protein